MIWTVAKREILENMKSTKLMVCLGISVILVTISTIINVQDYKQRHQDYLNVKEEMKSDYFNIKVYRPPQVLSILVEGKDRTLGNTLEMNYAYIPARPSSYMGDVSTQHLYVAGFPVMDLALVVRVVLSLMAIFLGYNAISGEKYHGTLRLLLANRLPRDQLLLGKAFGGSTVLLGSLLISSISALLILLFDPSISLLASDWVRILGLLAISALYLIFFYTLSLFVSVAVNRPSTALLTLLQVWIFLIIIYPNLSVIVVENLFSLPSEKEISQERVTAFRPYEEEYRRNYEVLSAAIDRGGEPSKEVSLRNIELKALRAEKGHEIDFEFNNRLTQQTEQALTISIFSPAVLFDEVADRLAKTGMAEYQRFMDSAFRYWQKHVELIKTSYKYDEYQDREAYIKEARPDFKYESEATMHSFSATLLQWIILFTMSVVFFALAYSTFLRKDVR